MGGVGGGGGFPLPAAEWEILVKGLTYSLGGGNLSWSDFDHLKELRNGIGKLFLCPSLK